MNGDLFSKVNSFLFALLLCVNVIPMTISAMNGILGKYQ